MAEIIDIQTNKGPIACRYHRAAEGGIAVLWVFGAGGGWGGPAGGLYPRLAEPLLDEGVSSIEVAYRRPGLMRDCVYDVLAAIDWLETQSRPRVVLVGHSFGGAVVLNAAAESDRVIAVASLSPQSYDAKGVMHLHGRPVIFIHGADDEVLPDRCSRDLYRMASEPKKLVIYPGCRHGLDQCREELDRDLLAWLRSVIVSRSTTIKDRV
jgi:dienelactone hydrolase